MSTTVLSQISFQILVVLDRLGYAKDFDKWKFFLKRKHIFLLITTILKKV